MHRTLASLALAGAALLCLPGCPLMTVGPTHRPDPMIDQARRLERFDGTHAHFLDHTSVRLAGIATSGLTPEQRDAMVELANHGLPADAIVQPLAGGAGRVVLIDAAYPRVGPPWGRRGVESGRAPLIRVIDDIYPIRVDLGMVLVAHGKAPPDPKSLAEATWLPAPELGQHRVGLWLIQGDSLNMADQRISVAQAYEKVHAQAQRDHLGIYETPIDRLLDAAARGQTQRVEEILNQHDMPPDAPDRFGRTALQMAVVYRRVETAAFLIDRGADLEQTAGDERTMLELARGLDIQKLLIERGAEVRPMWQSVRLLGDAAAANRTDIVALVLDHGIAVDAPDRRDNTALMYAARGYAVDTTRLLLDRGADPAHRNPKGESPADWVRQRIKRRKDKLHTHADRVLEMLAEAEAQGR